VSYRISDKGPDEYVAVLWLTEPGID